MQQNGSHAGDDHASEQQPDTRNSSSTMYSINLSMSSQCMAWAIAVAARFLLLPLLCHVFIEAPLPLQLTQQ
jgi:hypothetical protein